MSYANASKLLRLALMAASRVGVTLSEIEEAFECNRRAAQRMTDALEDLFLDTERWVDDERRPRWRLPAASIATFLAPTSDELAVLARAVENLERDGAVAEARTLRGLEAKAWAAVPKMSRARIEVDEEAMLEALGLATRPGPRPMANDMVDAVIATALKGRRCLKILYRNREDQAARWRSVAPHGLLLGARRYLIARDLSKVKSTLQHYRVEDISNAELLGDCFEPNEGFDIIDHTRRAFGSFVNAEEYGPIVWRFAPAAAAHARRYLFHPDQVLEEEPDGSIKVSFHASGHLEMCWHLYTWGDKVEVLEPAALAALVQQDRKSVV